MNEAPGAPQSRDPASAAAEVESHPVRHKRTVILIEIAVLFFLCYDERRNVAEGLSAIPEDDWQTAG